jgi:hypothetical protein
MEMNDWPKFIQEGRQYLTTARNGRRRKHVFNNELVCNLIGLSVEKLLVGLCLQRGHMPADHTLSGMVASANHLCAMDAALADAILMMDRIQNLCALEVNASWSLSDEQLDTLLQMNERVAAFVEENINRPHRVHPQQGENHINPIKVAVASADGLTINST